MPPPAAPATTAAGRTESFADVRRQAETLATRVHDASADAMRELEGEDFREAFGFHDASALEAALNTVVNGSGRRVAQTVAEVARVDANARDLAPTVKNFLSEAALRPPDGPAFLVTSLEERLRSADVGPASHKQAAEALSRALAQESERWSPDVADRQLTLSRSAMASLVRAEAARLEMGQAAFDGKWKDVPESVQTLRDKFEALNHPAQAACCSELLQEMKIGLRGLRVQRASRAAAGSILELQRCGEDHGAIHSSAPSAALAVIGQLRAAAQRSLDSLAEVVDRETEDVLYWAKRGQVPDGDAPKAVASDDIAGDMWGELSDEEAVQLLLPRLGTQQGQGRGTPDDITLFALARLDALKAILGEAREVLTCDAANSEMTIAISQGAPENLRGAATRASDALAATVSVLDEFSEGLLEVLDAEPRNIAAALGRWKRQWLAKDHAALDHAAVELSAAAPQLAAIVSYGADIIHATLASPASCRALLHTLRGIATLGGPEGKAVRALLLE